MLSLILLSCSYPRCLAFSSTVVSNWNPLEQDVEGFQAAITQVVVNLADELPHRLSSELCGFLRETLQIDSCERPTLSTLEQHVWMAKNGFASARAEAVAPCQREEDTSDTAKDSRRRRHSESEENKINHAESVMPARKCGIDRTFPKRIIVMKETAQGALHCNTKHWQPSRA